MDRTARPRRVGRPTRAEAEDTRGLLLATALRLFAAQGVAATSVRSIAREVGYSESVLYTHFRGKQALLEAVLTEHGPGLVPTALTALRDGAGTPATVLPAIAREALDVWSTEESRLLVSVVTREGLLHDPRLASGLAAVRDGVADLFRRWTVDGVVTTSLGGPERLAFSFTAPLGLVRVLDLHAAATPEEVEAARARAMGHVELFVAALGTGGTATP